jgi:hypothetical protein
LAPSSCELTDTRLARSLQPPSYPEVCLAADHPPPLRYRLLTGIDDRAFCEKVSQALDEGYELHGSPAITEVAGTVRVAQAVVRTAS